MKVDQIHSEFLRRQVDYLGDITIKYQNPNIKWMNAVQVELLKKSLQYCWAVLCVAMLPSCLWAACGGASPDWTAAGLDQSDVVDCLSVALDGDTIHLPSGDSTNWSSRLEISKQNITIQGNGISNTTINGYGFLISTSSNGARITGIHFNTQSSTPAIRISSGSDTGGTPVTGWMIDGNQFTADASRCISVYNGSTGLIANNTFYMTGETTICVSGRDDLDWQTASFHGQASQSVFIEDNRFISTSDTTTNHVMVANWGGSYVFRCNLVTDSGAGNTYRDMLDVHGYGHGTHRRGGRAAEIYGNYLDNRNYQYRTINLRAGSGRVFANRWSNSNTFIGLTDYRMADYSLSMAYPIDPDDCRTNSANYPAELEASNCTDNEGYPCCDQVGMGQDIVGTVRQAADPYYFWDNEAVTGEKVSVTPAEDLPSDYIQENREYFTGTTLPAGYSPYTYPHPDRGLTATCTCLSDENSSADTAITFWPNDLSPSNGSSNGGNSSCFIETMFGF